MKWYLAGAATVLFAAIVLVAVFFADITAWLERLVLSPETLMMKAVVSAAQDIGFADTENGHFADGANEYTVGIYLDGVMKEFLSNGDESWISALNLRLTTGKNEDLQKTQLSFLVKDESVMSFDVLRSDEKVWIGVPELNDAYLECALEDTQNNQIGALADKLPSAEDLVSIVRNYGGILIDGIHRVEKEEHQLNVEGVSQNVLKLTAIMRSEDCRKMLAEAAQQLKKDGATREVLNQMLGEELDFHESLVHYLEELSKTGQSDLRLITYLDSYNKLTGIELQDSTLGTLFCWKKTVSGEAFATILSFGKVVLSGKGSISDGKQTGEFALVIQDNEVLTYRLKDFSLTKEGFSGSVFFPFPREMMEASGLAFVNTEMGIELTQNDVRGVETVFINLLVGGRAQAGLTVTAANTDVCVDPPSNVVSVREQKDIEAWLQAFRWDSVPEKLNDAGVPVALIESLLS